MIGIIKELCYDIKPNNIKHNDVQYIDNHHNNIQHNDLHYYITLKNINFLLS
jgi:hypothetical protein